MFQKLYQHLEQINANTGWQQANFEHAEAWAQKISQQLAELNASVLALEKQRPPARRTVPATGFFLAGVSLVLLAMLGVYAYQLSAVADAVRDRSTAIVRAYGMVNNRYEEMTEQALHLEVRTARLDSIVRRQASTIVELKKLNTTAIRTIIYLERNFEQFQQRKQAQVQPPAVEQTLAH